MGRQLAQVQEKLRLALADVVKAEAAQLVAKDAQDVAETLPKPKPTSCPA